VFDGTAKPMPTLPCELPAVAICELTPITRAGLVEQRAAGVARVDRRVGLDDLVDREAVGRLDRAPDARDDALGRRCGRGRRVADGDRGVAHLDLARVGELQRLGVARGAAGSIFTTGQVARRVGALDLAVDAAPVGPNLTTTRSALPTTCALVHERPVVVDEEAGARATSVRIETTAGLAWA
jgi:hypothetical protein